MMASTRNLLFTLLVLPALTEGAAQAASITVDAGGACTLADSITAANTDAAAGGCPAGTGEDTITLEKDVVLAAALPDITSAVTIEGGGHKIDGNGGNFSVLKITSTSAMLILNETAITGGNNQDAYGGGGILAGAATSVTLNNSTINRNSALTGGGISALPLSRVTLISSTVSDNSANKYEGGGIAADMAIVTLNSSTISGNLAYRGGGIFAFNNAVISLNNCTISSNFAYNGGGVVNSAAFGGARITLTSSTVSGNLAYRGGGIINEGYMSLKSSLVSGNAAIINGNELVLLNMIESNFNLFGHSYESNAKAFSSFKPSNEDITATSDGTRPTALEAILNPLTDNGGPTKTHALPIGSPAIDLDTTCSAGLSTDQRGVSRPSRAGCDAGAFEFVAALPLKTNVLSALYHLLLKKK